MNAVTKNHSYAVLWSIGVLVLLMLALTLVGCGSVSTVASNPSASAAAPVSEEVAPPPVNDFIKQFGEAITWEDGLSISVSAPTEFVAGPYAAGVVEGWPQLAFEIVVTNGTDAVVEPFVFPSMTAAGESASSVFDSGNGVSGPPSTSLLPGQTIKWIAVFSVAGTEDMTMDISPGLMYENGIFTNIPF